MPIAQSSSPGCLDKANRWDQYQIYLNTANWCPNTADQYQILRLWPLFQIGSYICWNGSQRIFAANAKHSMPSMPVWSPSMAGRLLRFWQSAQTRSSHQGWDGLNVDSKNFAETFSLGASRNLKKIIVFVIFWVWAVCVLLCITSGDWQAQGKISSRHF